MLYIGDSDMKLFKIFLSIIKSKQGHSERDKFRARVTSSILNLQLRRKNKYRLSLPQL